MLDGVTNGPQHSRDVPNGVSHAATNDEFFSRGAEMHRLLHGLTLQLKGMHRDLPVRAPAILDRSPRGKP